MRPYRWLLIVVGVLGIAAMFVVGPGAMWINSFVHSDAFRREVESRAGESLGSPVQIKVIDFSIWRGVTLNGIAVKANTPQGTVVAQIESVRCSYSLFALLSRRLQFNAVTVTKPDVVLTQQPPSTVPTPAPPPTPEVTTGTPEQVDSGQTSPFQVVLEAAKISDGHLSLVDLKGATKADLQGVHVSADTSGFYEGKDVKGTLKIATIALPQNLSLTDFSTAFTYRLGNMAATPFSATAFSGRLMGGYTLDPSGPSTLEVNAEHIDMLQVGKTANPNSATQLSGSLALQSRWHGAETGKLTGEGNAQITDGKLAGVSILRELGGALRVRGLSEPTLKSVTTHFTVAEGTTRFDNLRIASNDFDMTGSGVINAQGQLDANMVLVLHGSAMGGIPGAAGSFFSVLPGGAGSIPFHVGGTVANPQADLNTRIFLQGSKVEKKLKNVLNNLFH